MTRPMTILEHLRGLESKATKGPWEAYDASCCPDMGGVVGPKHKVCADQVGRYGHPQSIEDARLIAEMRNALPALLARIASLEEALETAVHRWESYYEDQRTSSQPMEDAEAVELLKLCYDETWITPSPPPAGGTEKL